MLLQTKDGLLSVKNDNSVWKKPSLTVTLQFVNLIKMTIQFFKCKTRRGKITPLPGYKDQSLVNKCMKYI